MNPPLTRRDLLASVAAAAAASLLPQAWANEPILPASTLANDPQRPQFHLLPARNWMNDPNGPIYVNGLYHMFFQYNPHAAIWGDMSWNHAVSPDMLHWTHLPVALTPTPASPDAYGVFSGSALQVGKRVYAVYTGTRMSTPELATIRDHGTKYIQESQCLAWSDDPKLIHWTKAPEPIVPLPPTGMQVTGFRDPSAWKQGDWFYMTVGAGIAKQGGCVLLYRSKDMHQWEFLHPLTSGQWTPPQTANPCDDGEMWECPDFFPLDGGHVLIYSTFGKVLWESGKLDPATMTFHRSKTGVLDLGAFYAPKTQLDARGRRILWGWLQEKRPDSAMIQAGWSGMMSLPRVMSLDSDGTLRLQILPEVAALRAHPIPATVLPSASGELLVAGTREKDFTLTLRTQAAELLHLTYSAARHAFVWKEKTISLEAADQPTIHLFADASVLELILGQRIGLTHRFYDSGPTAPDIQVETTTKAIAWAIKPISPNRLTTPAARV